MPISARILKLVANDVIFLTMAKRELFPESVIQARGIIGAETSISMEKRLIWLSPLEGDMSSGGGKKAQAKELAEGKRTLKAWLKALASEEFFDVRILIAGDENPISGMLPDIERKGNWEMHLSSTDDEGVSVDFFYVPPDVNRRMSEARQQ